MNGVNDLTDMKKRGVRDFDFGIVLALFIVSFVIICPFSKIVLLPLEHSEMLRRYPELEWSGDWIFYDTATRWASYIVIAQRMIAGYCLLTVRKREAILLTVVTLWFSDPLFTAAEMLLSWFLFGIETGRLFGYAGGEIIVDVTVASLWTAYFMHSRRVRALYYQTSDD
jgi:hypothetical protein